jgi:hypothetical protein
MALAVTVAEKYVMMLNCDGNWDLAMLLRGYERNYSSSLWINSFSS